MIAVTAFASGIFAGDSGARTIPLIASGETHAMLLPCDCPEEPGGGLAERATLLRQYMAAGPVLLLDAGGFSGGGIYDAYTAGRPLDSLRTMATLRAMAAMKYDAVAVGDEELQYPAAWLARFAQQEGLALISANCFSKGKKRLFSPYRIIKKEGIRFGVTAVTTTERLFPLDTTVTVADPFASLRAVWDDLEAASDVQIILSHLGEEALSGLVDSFPGAEVIVNGHRKSSPYAVRQINKTVVMQFGYEGKKISRARLAVTGPPKMEINKIDEHGWLIVAPATPADSVIASLVSAGEKEEARLVYDLYIMSGCAYGREALREVLEFADLFGAMEWHLWFIGEVAGDSLATLHGEEEADDEMVWLGVQAVYPELWLPFLAGMSRDGATTAGIIRTLGMNATLIERWVKRKGKKSLADHYRRSMRLTVTASPTLFINNARYDKPIESRRLAKARCVLLTKKPAFCDSFPACFDDGDCTKKGYIGRCDSTGSCTFLPDQAFVFSVLVAGSTLRHPENAVIATTEELFPNVTIDLATIGSPKGRLLIEKYAPVSLPFYLFGHPVAKAYHFGRIESGIVKVPGGYIFKDGITPKNYYINRVHKDGSFALYLDPVFPDVTTVLPMVLKEPAIKKKVKIVPLVYRDPAKDPVTIEEKVRREESLRWLVLDSLFKDRYAAYLKRYVRNPGSSSWWYNNLRETGVDERAFMKALQKHDGLLLPHWKDIQSLDIKGPISLLIDNRQLVRLRGEAELLELFQNIARKQD